MNIKKAVETLTQGLKEDRELYLSYQANIAMAFFDEARRNKIYKSNLGIICNNAADNFLKMWIGE